MSAFAIRRQGGGTRKHEALIRGDAELCFAQVLTRDLEQRSGSPGFAVFRTKDADLAIAGHVAAAFTKDAEPLIPKTDEIGEAVVRGLVPDLADIEERGCGGHPFDKSRMVALMVGGFVAVVSNEHTPVCQLDRAWVTAVSHSQS